MRRREVDVRNEENERKITKVAKKEVREGRKNN
jgi:hypothetical protein